MKTAGEENRKRRESRELYTDFPFGRFDGQYEAFGVKPYSRFNRAFLDLCASIEGISEKKIYDIGCGCGYWFGQFEHAGFRKDNIIGLDQSVSAVKELKARGYYVIEGDALELPFPGGEADCVFSCSVLQFTADPEKAFGELCRILKKNGYLIICLYNASNPYYFISHTMTFPFRLLYRHYPGPVLKMLQALCYLPVQLFSLFFNGRLTSVRKIKTLIATQILAPFAHTFSRKRLERLGEKNGLHLIEQGICVKGFFRFAVFSKNGYDL